MVGRFVEPRAVLPGRHPQVAPVVQAIQQVRGDALVVAPVAGHAAMLEGIFHRLRMRGFALLPDMGQDLVGHLPGGGIPAAPGRARVHPAQPGARHETVVDEAVFLHRQLWITFLQLAGAVATGPVHEDQVLRPRRRPHRISLHKAQALDGLCERERLEQAAADGVPAEVFDLHGGRVAAQGVIGEHSSTSVPSGART